MHREDQINIYIIFARRDNNDIYEFSIKKINYYSVSILLIHSK